MRYYLIHMYTGWVRGFPSEEKLVSFVKEHGFTRQQMYSYLVIEGMGLWSSVASQLPAGPPDPAMAPPMDLQDPF
jgi:hypothetical protein